MMESRMAWLKKGFKKFMCESSDFVKSNFR